MGVCVTAHFNPDVPAAHLVSNGGGRAGAEEGVKNQVAGIGGDVNNAFNQAFRFWRSKSIIFTKEGLAFFFPFL